MVISLNYGTAFVSQDIEAIDETDDLDHRIEVSVCYSIRENQPSELLPIGMVGIVGIVNMDVASY